MHFYPYTVQVSNDYVGNLCNELSIELIPRDVVQSTYTQPVWKYQFHALG